MYQSLVTTDIDLPSMTDVVRIGLKLLELTVLVKKMKSVAVSLPRATMQQTVTLSAVILIKVSIYTQC